MLTGRIMSFSFARGARITGGSRTEIRCIFFKRRESPWTEAHVAELRQHVFGEVKCTLWGRILEPTKEWIEFLLDVRCHEQKSSVGVLDVAWYPDITQVNLHVTKSNTDSTKRQRTFPVNLLSLWILKVCWLLTPLVFSPRNKSYSHYGFLEAVLHLSSLPHHSYLRERIWNPSNERANQHTVQVSSP